MAASFLAAMPTWRNFDPMPVLASDDKEKRHASAAEGENDGHDETAHEDDDGVDEMFDR